VIYRNKRCDPGENTHRSSIPTSTSRARTSQNATQERMHKGRSLACLVTFAWFALMHAAGSLCGELIEAEREYREAVRVANGLTRALPELAWFLFAGKGEHQYDEKKFREAEETYREVISLSTNYALAYNNLADLLIADSNRWGEAEVLIRKSLDYARAEEKPWCLESLGELLAKLPQRRAEAVAAYREALAGFSVAGNSNEVDRVRDILNRLETQ